MAAVQLTDRELWTELKSLGCLAGPITESTRPVYLKKLKKLRDEQQRAGTPKSRNINRTIPAAGTSGVRARPASDDVTQMSNCLPSRNVSEKRLDGSKFVLGFSSDESDAEAAPKRPFSKRDQSPHQRWELRPMSYKRQGFGFNTVSSHENRRKQASLWESNLSAMNRTEFENHVEEYQNNRVNNINSIKSSYSDSEEEVGSSDVWCTIKPRRTPGKTGSSANKSKGMETGKKHTGAATLLSGSTAFGSLGIAQGGLEEMESDKKVTSFTANVNNCGSVLNDRERTSNSVGAHRKSSLDANSTFNTTSKVCSIPNNTSASHTLNHIGHLDTRHTYCQSAYNRERTGPEEELLQQFKSEEMSSSARVSAHYLSMVLLTAGCLFFLILGLTYLKVRGSAAPQNKEIIINNPCGPKFEELDIDQKKSVLNILHKLHDYLAKTAGDHDCGNNMHDKKRSLSVQDAFEYLSTVVRGQDMFNASIQCILDSKDDVGIRCIGATSEKLTDVSDVKYLESTRPQMPLICRFQRAFVTVIHRMLLLLVCVGLVWSVLSYMKYRWRREEEEIRKMYDIAEKIIDVLKSHNEACQENKGLEPYLPIPHVRDSLIQPEDRKKMKNVWNRAVDFLAASESRLQTEKQRIGGSDFMVWRWVQPLAQYDKVSAVPSKVWQGQAFHLDRRNSPPNSLTPCLKIRNMFDPVIEVGDHWHLTIQEAILEKCSDNDGIVHIAVDKNSREGCVYVKCLAPEYAGKAFKALHGSWFDGKLVTVKYLRLDRYHHRFPSAINCNTPLKPSNKYMTSMSHLRLRTTATTSSSQGTS
ncbi:inner nuclear membrane protein Man1 [Protopterus annectens]|uniref:inner nuclear membrane protein Man1 n=1 Tax=Protopterus annectens TaxID=7888 RepID=UPI001CFA6235|nr:inner nuclear membrane protein Man1 [Protopterus annectens]